MRDELSGAYYETVNAIKNSLQNTNRNSLPIGNIIESVPFESSVTRTVIRDLVESGELREYDDGKIALNE